MHQTGGHVLLDIDQVKAKMGWKSDDTIYDYIRERGFPRPLKASRKNSRWLLSEVDAYIEQLPRGATGANPVPKRKAA